MENKKKAIVVSIMGRLVKHRQDIIGFMMALNGLDSV